MLIENVILENLIHNEEYTRRVLPYLKDEYFQEQEQALVFSKIYEHIGKYNKPPTQDELLVELRNQKGISQGVFQSAVDLVGELSKRSKQPAMEWLIENTEGFCKDRALYNAVVAAANLIEDKQKVGQIPDLMKDALSVSFDNNVGHDFTESIQERYRLLHQTQEYKIPFGLKELDQITNGGLPRKTLTVVAAGTGAGKSLFMTNFAAQHLLKGYNVLYITMEMAEERICERVDANILNMKIQDIAQLSMQEYTRRLENKLTETKARMIVKEYPTASAGSTQFRALLNELKLKKDFVPDIIYIDYLNICASSRFKAGNVNSYQYVKAIAEEIRGLSTEFNVPIVSATQLNRSGTDSSDVGLGEISDSHGLSMTVDMLISMIRTEELDEQNKVLFKQLKNRFSDMASMLRFAVGIDRSKMKLFECDEVQLSGARPVVSGSPEESRVVDFRKPELQKTNMKFRGIKV